MPSPYPGRGTALYAAPVTQDDRDSGITLAELLAAYSLAIDLGLGQPMEHLVRAWRIAARLGRHVGYPEEQQAALFHVSMLAWVGCVADAPEVAASFGDDIAFRADSYDVDLGGLSGQLFFLTHAGAGGPLPQRLLAAANLVRTGGSRVMQGIQGHCLTTSVLAEQLGLGTDVSLALRQFFARWDGRGVPEGVGGTDIALPVRLFHLADVAEVHHRNGGIEAARRVALGRRGKQFDPALADAFCQVADEVLPDEADDRDALEILAADPALSVRLTESGLDEALGALADFTDLRSGPRAGHSRGVADLAADAARVLGLPDAEVTTARRAGFVHDIGLHGIPATTLDKAGPLGATEKERFRAAAYYTERVLTRPPALARIGVVASLVHERMDGSGYHRGVSGPGIPAAGRVLAAACAFRAMTEPRAHREAVPSKQAAATLRAEARSGRLDPDAVDAVLTAAGSGGRRKVAGPSGLTSREVEVLLLIARGSTARAVAARLSISPKTVGTHIERIYSKTGASSRSTATLFALRTGLLDPLDL